MATTPPCLACTRDAEYKGYCRYHAPAPYETTHRSKRLPPGWRTIAQGILTRDRGVCYLCGNPGADAVDHIQNNDDNSPSNLAAVHDRVPPHCHQEKTQKEAQIGRLANTPKKWGTR